MNNINKKMRVGLVYDPVYLEHETGDHVENKDRLTTTISLLEEIGIKDGLVMLPARDATMEEVTLIHAKEYVTQIKKMCENGGGSLDYDTVTSPGTYRAAILAAGGVITATEAVLNKQVNCAFALVRPPGHHATCWQGKGFCIFNNIAIAAKYILSNYDIQRILIVDFDVHHGNGTQDAFYTDPNVLYFSTHQYPLYPGTGQVDEIGGREGEGFNINVPMIAGWGDDEYQAIFEDLLAPIALKYQPQLIMVSAGYDAHWADNLASMQLTVSGYTRIAEILKVLAGTICQGNLVFTLEGGYHLQALSYSVASTLNMLMGNNALEDPLGEPQSNMKFEDFHKFLNMLKDKHHI